MRKKIIFLSFLCLLLVGLNALKVKASAFTVETQEGASVRLTDPNGIRFTGKVTGDASGADVTYGIVFGKGTWDANSLVIGAPDVYSKEVDGLDQNGEFHISMVNLPDYALGQNITARAYVKEGTNVTYASNVCTRNLYDICKALKADGETNEYINGIADKTFNVTYNYNGGSTKYATREEMAQDFLNDFNNFGTKTSYTSIASYNGSNKKLDFWRDDNMRAKWLWIWGEISAVSKAQGISLTYINYIVDNNVTGEAVYASQNIPLYMMRISKDTWNNEYKTSYTQLNSQATTANYDNVGENDFRKYLTSQTEEKVTTPKDDLPINVYKTGYTFMGWYDNASFTGKVYEKAPKDGSLYAKLILTNYEIEYVLPEGATNSSNNPVTFNYEMDNINLENANITGKIFEGWYLDAAYENKVTTINPKCMHNIRLYARFIEVPVSNITLNYNDDLNFKEVYNEIVADLKFYGTHEYESQFLTSSTGNSYSYDYVPFVNVFNNEAKRTEFLAKWSWLINFVADAHSTSSSAYVSNIRNLANGTSSVEGIYVFLQELKGMRDGNQAVVYSSSTNYDWGTDPNNFKEILKEKTGTQTKTLSLERGASLPVLTRNYYKFEGWYTTPDFSGEPITIVPQEDAQIYAKWTSAGEVKYRGLVTSAKSTTGTEISIASKSQTNVCTWYYWYKIYLKYDETVGAYKIVGSNAASQNTTTFTDDYDYVIGGHSATIANVLGLRTLVIVVSEASSHNYYVQFDKEIPSSGKPIELGFKVFEK